MRLHIFTRLRICVWACVCAWHVYISQGKNPIYTLIEPCILYLHLSRRKNFSKETYNQSEESEDPMFCTFTFKTDATSQMRPTKETYKHKDVQKSPIHVSEDPYVLYLHF